MGSRTDKKEPGRKWVDRGVLLGMIVLCALLLLRCGGKPATVTRYPMPPQLHQAPPRPAEAVAAAREAAAPEAAEEVPAAAVSQPEKAVSAPDEPAPVQEQRPQPVMAPPPVELAANPPPPPAEAGETLPAVPESRFDSFPVAEDICPGAPDSGERAAAAKVSPGRTFTDPATGMTFVLVKGGCFRMGSATGDPDEIPVHEVCVDDFYLGEYEVTQAQYEWIMGRNPSSFRACSLPVESVSWEEAQAYVRKLGRTSGRDYRLPSEAEWEYAARSGWKEEAAAAGFDPALAEYGGYIQNLGKPASSWKRKPNALGLYDMTCNVWEWVSDWYAADYYASSPRGNPQGPPAGSRRVIRAGMGSRSEPRFAKRYGAAPDESYNHFGFRVAFPAPPSVSGRPEVREDVSALPADSGSRTALN